MFFQQLINGLNLGSAYAVIAIGYTLVFGVLNIINMAHGEIFMFGAFIGLILVTEAGANIFTALIAAVRLRIWLRSSVRSVFLFFWKVWPSRFGGPRPSPFRRSLMGRLWMLGCSRFP